MTFDFSFLPKVFAAMLKAMGVTLSLTIFTFLFSLILGFLLSLLILKPIPFVTRFVKIWISFFRGTPLVAQFFFIYFGLAQLFPLLRNVKSFWWAVGIMTLHYSSYMAIIIQSAVQSVGKGQMEACLSTGMSYYQSLFRIILPQASIVALPNLFNSFLDIIKGTSIAFTIGVVEMMAAAQIEAAAYYRHFEAYAAVIFLYWIMNIIFCFFQEQLTKRLKKTY